MTGGDLDALADSLRLATARIRIERWGMGADVRHVPLPWSQLAESERNQWRDHARAATEVMT